MYRIGSIPSIPYYPLYIKFVGFIPTVHSLICCTSNPNGYEAQQKILKTVKKVETYSYVRKHTYFTEYQTVERCFVKTS